ncbi:MAG: hypothetical protein KME19_12635 [Microcoleus vaginatus WJT46-NPBG5]|jgi:hypothetical protein|nr:hypothetical protein [Microcoleus vaginatus WJT46-NPBG5]
MESLVKVVRVVVGGVGGAVALGAVGVVVGAVGGVGGAVALGAVGVVVGGVGGAVGVPALCPPIQEQQKSQQPTDRENRESSNPPSPPGKTLLDQKNAKESSILVLVISASQADFLESLKDKKHIDVSEAEQLYQITRYLWLGSETELSQKRLDDNEYSVAKGAESEYNIYLVEIKLNQDDNGFKPNINQLKRHDAFRKLADSEVDVKVSERLQIKAYENLKVYNR